MQMRTHVELKYRFVFATSISIIYQNFSTWDDYVSMIMGNIPLIICHLFILGKFILVMCVEIKNYGIFGLRLLFCSVSTLICFSTTLSKKSQQVETSFFCTFSNYLLIGFIVCLVFLQHTKNIRHHLTELTKPIT